MTRHYSTKPQNIYFILHILHINFVACTNVFIAFITFTIAISDLDKYNSDYILTKEKKIIIV